jgi:Flp pilus assembly protein TadG
MMPRRQRHEGQALVEFAFALPLFTLFVFVVIQLSLVFVAYYSETRMARETARWLAINHDATDLQVAQHVQTTLLPGLVGLASPGTVSVANKDTVLSTSMDTVYRLNYMEVHFTPCTPTGSVCGNANRVSGQTLYVNMLYDVSPLLFLPSSFRIGSLTAKIPTQLPAYKVSVMTE